MVGRKGGGVEAPTCWLARGKGAGVRLGEGDMGGGEMWGLVGVGRGSTRHAASTATSTTSAAVYDTLPDTDHGDVAAGVNLGAYRVAWEF